MTRLTLLLLLVTTLPVRAEEWVPLNTNAITETLSETLWHYDDAKQHFYASGRTLYDAGRPSWGYWRTEADQYCSQWPPRNEWSCYGLEKNGDRVRFVAPDGSYTEGRRAK